MLPGSNDAILTFDDIAVVNSLIENLVQRQPDGAGTIFNVHQLLERMTFFAPGIKPERYLRAVVEFLQKLVAIGVLVEDHAQLISEHRGLYARRYKPGGWIDMREWIQGSASRALGVPYIAHVFGDIVVRVHCGEGESERIGSGVVVGSDVLVTNAHVVQSGEKTHVSFGKSDRVAATSVECAKDARLDLAIVRAPGLCPVPVALFRDPYPAETVVALGYPIVPQVIDRPLLRFPGAIASDGYVDTYFGQRFSIVCSVFSPGSSGGGVFGANGQLVGLVVQSLFSEMQSPGRQREFPLFHAMIPGSVILAELQRMGVDRTE